MDWIIERTFRLPALDWLCWLGIHMQFRFTFWPDGEYVCLRCEQVFQK